MGRTIEHPVVSPVLPQQCLASCRLFSVCGFSTNDAFVRPAQSNILSVSKPEVQRSPVGHLRTRIEMTATYCRLGRGKSLNAYAAEDGGRFPASIAARILGVSTGMLRSVCSPVEWHHVGKFAREVDYYTTVEHELAAQMRSDAVTGGDAVDSCLLVLRTFRSRRRNHPMRDFWLRVASEVYSTERSGLALERRTCERYRFLLPFQLRNKPERIAPDARRAARLERRRLQILSQPPFYTARGDDHSWYVSSFRARVRTGDATWLREDALRYVQHAVLDARQVI